MNHIKSYLNQHRSLHDWLNILLFVLGVVLCTLFINCFIFRVYSVSGISMEPTLTSNDRLYVNKIPLTIAHLQGKDFTPTRDSIVVFKNPMLSVLPGEEYIVKRVIGLPGERVVVSDGTITVYNSEHPAGFKVDEGIQGPESPTSGEADVNVPEGEIFVSGDNRIGEHSFDSRSGLGTIKLSLIQGEASFRFFPFNKITTF
jgi:signal peptidase I